MEECPICFCKIKEHELEVLTCGHKFHHTCILLSFKSNTQYNNSRVRECPYCRERTDYLELKPGEIPIRNVHKEYEEIRGNIKVSKLDKYLIKDKCNAILMSGVNKGQQCKKKINEGCFCKTHSNFNKNAYMYFSK